MHIKDAIVALHIYNTYQGGYCGLFCCGLLLQPATGSPLQNPRLSKKAAFVLRPILRRNGSSVNLDRHFTTLLRDTRNALTDIPVGDPSIGATYRDYVPDQTVEF